MRIMGVYREEKLAGKPEADRKIALAVADALRKNPLVEDVRMVRGEDTEQFSASPISAIFSMARSRKALEALSKFASEMAIVNSPISASLSQQRYAIYYNMNNAGIPAPKTRGMRPPEVLGQEPPFVIKRIYTHGKPDDTLVIKSKKELDAAAKLIEQRKDSFYLVQEFIEGQAFKFYGVGEDVFPLAFADAAPKEKVSALADYAKAMAKICMLDVYGGDFIYTSDGRFYFTDLNDWPSFSPIREHAAQKIADIIEKRIDENNAEASVP